MFTFTLTIPEILGQLIIPVFLPLLVGLVTTRVTDAGKKAVLLASLALVTSLCTEAAAAWEMGAAYDIGRGILTTVPIFVVAVATHYGIWKPAGISHTLQNIGTPKPIDDSPVFD